MYEARTPTNEAELKSYLGLLTYYQRFLPNVSTKMGTTARITALGAELGWAAIRQMLFKEAKHMPQDAPLPIHYDPNGLLLVSCDASPYGIRAVPKHLNVMVRGSQWRSHIGIGWYRTQIFSAEQLGSGSCLWRKENPQVPWRLPVPHSPRSQGGAGVCWTMISQYQWWSHTECSDAWWHCQHMIISYWNIVEVLIMGTQTFCCVCH